MDTQIQKMDMFTAPLWTCGWDKHAQVKDKFLSTVAEYKKNNVNQNRKHVNTFITTDDLQHNPAFDEFVELLKEVCVTMKQDWCFEEDVKIGINKMWASETGPQGTIIPHHVPFTFLYGMYFLETPAESGEMVVEYPTLDKGYFANFLPTQPSGFNAEYFSSPMPEGYVVMMPSHLQPRTTPNHADQKRTIIHFTLTIIQ